MMISRKGLELEVHGVTWVCALVSCVKKVLKGRAREEVRRMEKIT
jgi:hypothetical protein